jgi:hypothetical protein
VAGGYNACMPKSAFAAALDEVQQPMTALLKNLGFRRRGRTYNRTVADGVVHAVNFQMGQFPIGDYVIAGLRESYYGRFTVNLGVMLPAVLKLESGQDPPAFVPEHYCEIRERLGTLVYGDDVWWDLDHQIAATARSMVELMDRAGLPFLDQYESYSSVVSQLDEGGTLPSSNAGRSALVGALICAATGERERAAKFFDRAIVEAKRIAHKGFLGHVHDLRSSCGL